MGMQEFEEGRLGEPTQDLDKLFKEQTADNVKATHYGTMDKLKNLKDRIDLEKIVTTQDFKEKQLDRIEAMLSSIVLHFNIPYQGILTIKNPEKSN